jgi:hypothetical protein
MYSKEELKEIRTAFWDKFNLEMRKIRSANGRKMNWLMYPTDVKNLYVRLHCDQYGARVSVDIQGKDLGVRQLIWEQLHELKAVMEQATGKTAIWDENASSSTVPHFCSIYWEKTDANLFQPEKHDEIISFLKDKIVAFDAFYQEYKEILINLTS